MLLLLAAVFALGARGGTQEDHGEGLTFVRSLGNGINVGNSLDVKEVLKYRRNPQIEDFETYWKNPPLTRELFHAIAETGIKTVRIPVSWAEHLRKDDKIDPAWMARVAEVVDYALDEGLYVILDTHHEPWLIPEEAQEQEVTARLTAIWAQVAQQFRQKDEHLLFEGMNEPRLQGTEYEWNSGTAEGREVVNRLNQAFVETVRSSGGNNRSRWLLIDSYCSREEEDALSVLEIPDDGRIIVSVHCYSPYRFTGEENGTAKWTREKPSNTASIDAMMERLDRLFLSRGIPVIITEFGCRDKGNLPQRLDWTDYYLSKASETGVPCIWWDNGKEYSIIDRETCDISQPEIMDLIVQYCQ